MSKKEEVTLEPSYPLPSTEELVFTSLKRTSAFFADSDSHEKFLYNLNPKVHESYLSLKVRDEYEHVKVLPKQLLAQQGARPSSQSAPINTYPTQDMDLDEANPPSADGPSIQPGFAYPVAPGVELSETTQIQPSLTQTATAKILNQIPDNRDTSTPGTIRGSSGALERFIPGNSTLATRMPEQRVVPPPVWHAPWKLMRVISGHLGWVRSVAVEPGNEWFATGAGDRVIKIWDLASGTLKLSLTGHISTVRGLVVSPRHPYIFSVGEDKMVKCWDLEYNKVVRHYHGHLSGVHCVDIHPTLDVLITGGRDATARVWDMRSRQCIHTLSGHNSTVASLKAQEADPQILTGSMDSTIRLWDLAAGKTMATLTHHKKSVRALVLHPTEFSFASASPDNIKQWACPEGKFIQNLEGHRAIVNTLSVNGDNVLFSGGDNGSMRFWDWKSGYNFQKMETVVQPGSLESESGVFASTFDHTGTRLITCEADKTIKVWKEDETATPETHPIEWKPSLLRKRY